MQACWILISKQVWILLGLLTSNILHKGGRGAERYNIKPHLLVTMSPRKVLVTGATGFV